MNKQLFGFGNSNAIKKNLYSQEISSIAKTSFYGKTYIAQIYGKDIIGSKAIFKIAQLGIRNGKYAIIIKKLLESAVANAKQKASLQGKALSEENLYVSKFVTGRGTFLRRREWKGRGRTGMIRRPFANVLLELKEVKDGTQNTAI